MGPANIREQIKIDVSGNNMSGKFTIDQYAADGVTVLVHLGGTVSGTRVVVY